MKTNNVSYKCKKYLLTGLCFVSTAVVADTSLFFGKWGTETQCARALITPNGTKYSAPFEVSADWLQHGDVWCRLNWQSAVVNEDSANGVAEALCGEDDNRNYRINFNLTGSELTLIWNGEFANSGLMRCLSKP